MPYWLFRDLLRSWLGVGLNEPDLRVRVALRRALDSAGRARRPRQLYPYLGAMLGLTLEPEAQARVAELIARGAPVPNLRGGRAAAGRACRRTAR